jgi:SAM-dependent methyltransferase
VSLDANPQVTGDKGNQRMIMQETEKGEQNFWDELYEIDPHHFGTGESEFAIKCSKVMKEYGVNRVLDIGCGYGRERNKTRPYALLPFWIGLMLCSHFCHSSSNGEFPP